MLAAGENSAINVLRWPREVSNSFSNLDTKWMTVDRLERGKDGKLETTPLTSSNDCKSSAEL